MDTVSIHSMEERVLILSSVKKDGELSKTVLNRNGIAVTRCHNVLELCLEIKSGAGAVLLAGEAMDRQGIETLKRTLVQEPPWSHLPFMILLNSGELSDMSGRSLSLLEPIKNVTFLERPVRVVTMVGILKAALADRARQYEVRRLVLELEKSNAALSQFASTASHDLQEPLRTVVTHIQLFEREHRNNFPQQGMELLGIARDAARRMQILVADLLAYSQVGADKLNLSVISSEKLIDEVLDSIHTSVKDSGAKIHKKGTFPQIKGDEMKLARLFQNLLSNAIKFQRTGTTPEIEVGAKETDKEMIFWVKDNGIGIRSKDVPTVFKVFQRLHSRNEYPGSGIGLATCAKIVERHDGTISVDSRESEGTTFSVHLPLNAVKVGNASNTLAG